MTCFECGAHATEMHHVLPKSLGGIKTVPLCASCHCKVHSLQGNRMDHRELTALGQYKARDNGRLIAVFAWYSWDVLPKYKKDYLKSYAAFSGDDMLLSESQLRKRIKVIERWIDGERWDLFRELARHNGPEFVELVQDTIATHYSS